MTAFAFIWMMQAILPYALVFLGAFTLSLILTPIARDFNRRIGMVDKPGGRRVNKTPIPRGGGVAVIVSFAVTTLCFVVLSDKPLSPVLPDAIAVRMICLSICLGAIGFLDDKFGLRPSVKLLGQVTVAVLAFFWCHIGFHTLASGIPAWLDLPLTVFWIVGAINAFNLIDGLDGLASGLAIIAAAGMAGALFFTESPCQMIVYLSFIGSVLGFLRYNFNPASVFLGDTGAMFLGFFLSTVSLMTRTGDSLIVSVMVPMLAMGVPIFDTALAIVRRTVRAALRRMSGDASGDAEGTKVMQADADHSHHRLLRSLASQRKVAMLMYAIALFLILVGIGTIALRDRASGLFIVAFLMAMFIIVKDMSRVELLDVGRLADAMAHGQGETRRRRAALAVPLLVFADIAILLVMWYATLCLLEIRPTPQMFHTLVPLRIVPVFIAVVLSRAYSTAWARAMLSNYMRLMIGVLSGVLVSSACLSLLGYHEGHEFAFPVIYGGFVLFAMLGVRSLRQILRDYFYGLNVRSCSNDPNVSRVLVFGSGLRYRAFRRELVRNSAHMARVIVGLVDDDILLRGKFVGGVRVDGPHMDARRIVSETRADSVVIACELSPERLKVVVDMFKACGVKVSCFNFIERAL